MLGFKPRILGVGSDRSANCAITTALEKSGLKRHSGGGQKTQSQKHPTLVSLSSVIEPILFEAKTQFAPFRQFLDFPSLQRSLSLVIKAVEKQKKTLPLNFFLFCFFSTRYSWPTLGFINSSGFL